MRKIQRKEVKKTAEILAEIFKDYAAYDVMFKRDKRQKKKIYYFFCYEIYASQDYTYEFDDFSSIAAVKKPTDKDTPTRGLWKDPFFAAAFLLFTGTKARKLADEYIAFAEDVAEKYYDPAVDCYIKNIGVRQDCRGQGRLRKMIDELCGDAPAYLETHDANNVEIYKKLGFELCEAVEWRGVTHYAMKKNSSKV